VKNWLKGNKITSKTGRRKTFPVWGKLQRESQPTYPKELQAEIGRKKSSKYTKKDTP